MTDSAKPRNLPRILAITIPIVIVVVSLAYYLREVIVPKGDAESTVRIAYLPIYVDLPLFVALDHELFEQRSLGVEVSRFKSSPDMGAALLAGKVDAVASIAFSVALGTESRDPSKFWIFIVDAENEDHYLSAMVAAPGSNIESVEDLRGRKVGIFPGPTAGTFYRLILRKHGLDPEEDLTISELSPDLHVKALASGKIDALMTYEPMATDAVVNHGAVKFMPGAIEREILNPWQAGVWIVSRDYATEHPDPTCKMITGLYEALDLLAANPQQSKSALNEYTGIQSEVALATPDIPFTKMGEVDLATLQKQADIFHDEGVIDKRIDVTTMMLPESYLSEQCGVE